MHWRTRRLKITEGYVQNLAALCSATENASFQRQFGDKLEGVGAVLLTAAPVKS